MDFFKLLGKYGKNEMRKCSIIMGLLKSAADIVSVIIRFVLQAPLKLVHQKEKYSQSKNLPM